MDEIAIHDETRVAEVSGTEIEEYTLSPADLGLESHPVSAVSGGSPEENAVDLEGIVSGRIEGAKREIVLANAGAAIYVAGEAGSLAEGAEIADMAIDEGRATKQLESMRRTVTQ
jgi:anthranilate phosphoribosyltransferase